MKSTTLILNTLVCLVGASPLERRQELDFDLLDSVPDPTPASVPIGPTADTVTFDLPAVTQAAIEDPLPVEVVGKRSLGSRSACQQQPLGAGPVPVVDTPEGFSALPDFAAAANSAAVPDGYYQTFQNLNGSNNAYGYNGYSTLKSYDTAECARRCNNIKTCSGFNLYFERDPTLDPAAACPNPASTTNIKCVYWGGYISAANANNFGQWRNNFQVVIAGSNGYMKTLVPPVDGFTGVSLGNAAINAPLNCLGQDTYMGSKIFTSAPFDTGLCAAACHSQNDYNTAHPPANGSPKLCKFFVTFMSDVNGSPEGQYCAMYTQAWDSSYATNIGQYRGKNHYTNDYVFAYTNSTDDGTPVCPN
ncbi:hypothetical protein F5Y19DRAFT_401245 [Xylariaceae sp. FL1651]|nr:hypothetical protein F5Y19DRAFT_401245 [Xylariaceae sp. FL1651]